MALVMVHLLVAREWAALHPEYLNSPEYYYGCIAPDAIHVRDGNDKSRKNAVHCGNWSGSRPEEMREYWRTRRSDFDVGYAIHCLTDGIWVDGYREAFPGIRPNGHTDPVLYYNDVYSTERTLYRETPGRAEMINMVARADAPEDHPYILKAEFDKWRENVLREYDPVNPAIGEWRTKSYREMGLPDPNDGEPVFITPEYIQHFMKVTAQKIDEITRRFDSHE